MSKKLIIVFEGIEGSGKSFHLNNIKKYLKIYKKKFISLREPGGSIGSEKIRKLILSNKSNFNMYKKFGFFMAGDRKNYYKTSNGFNDAYIMTILFD